MISRGGTIAATLALWVSLLGSTTRAEDERPKVELRRVPEKGIQPRTAVAADGTVHLVWLTGDPAAGDLWWARSSDDAGTFSEPVRVNSHSGSAVAIGNVRGADVAIGADGRLHVVWFGSAKAEPRGPDGATPMLYTRLAADGESFEPERNVITRRIGLDGGGSVAADGEGKVWVVWHAPQEGPHGEANRRVWVAESTDGGETFAPERLASADPTGCCGCCGLRAGVDSRGELWILYRSAFETENRDMHAIVAREGRLPGAARRLDGWKAKECVMSTASLVPVPATGGGGLLAAWETRGQARLARFAVGEVEPRRVVDATGVGTGRKHPALAVNGRGETCLVWTDGMGWRRGGRLAWQVYDADLRPIPGAQGAAPDVPTWSLVAVIARRDGGFTILY